MMYGLIVTSEAVHAERDRVGCGLMEAKRRLEHRQLRDLMHTLEESGLDMDAAEFRKNVMAVLAGLMRRTNR